MPLMHWLRPFTMIHLRRIVEMDTTAKHLSAPIRRILLFAAYEAKQKGSAEIEQQHLVLGALRERRNPVDGKRAAALRDAMPQYSVRASRLKLSSTARQMVESATTFKDILATNTND